MKEKIEIFHLLFLQYFSAKMDKSLYAIKGGCNLRFFFGSIRYSEDLDIDFKTIATTTLKKKVDGLLNSQNFKKSLNSMGIALDGFTTPKQTDTTQRWKISLLEAETNSKSNTKIEFSRRGMEDGILHEKFPDIYKIKYNFPFSIFISHYNGESAFMNALIGRRETQARDIFDLYHLMGMGKKPRINISPEDKETASNNIKSLNFKDFKSQVVSYLEPSYMEQYDSEKIWEKIISEVSGYLEVK